MKACPLILSLLLVFAAAPVLRAQWSGSLNFSTGLGGMTGNSELEAGLLGHLLAQGDVSVRYQTEQFTWKTVVGGRWEPRTSDHSRLNMSIDERGVLDLEVVYKTVKAQPLQANVRSDFDWKPAGSRHYSAWA